MVKSYIVAIFLKAFILLLIIMEEGGGYRLENLPFQSSIFLV